LNTDYFTDIRTDNGGVLDGDSGVPLMDKATRELIGIAAERFERTSIPPGLYTRIGTIVPWINEHMG
jgi:hypothetical protein